VIKYNIIYPDCPWLYSDGQKNQPKTYGRMRPKDLRYMDVAGIAADDCALFLWATSPMLPTALGVMRAWGFDYRTVAFTWIKTNKDGTPKMGMGHWTRQNAEFCLLGIKGRPKRISQSVHSVIMAPTREHSRKPDEARDRIVKLFGDVPRIELFARQRFPGWDAWGDQVENPQPILETAK